jgi:hypothetical protein
VNSEAQKPLAPFRGRGVGERGTELDCFPGDTLGLPIPATAEALRAGGEAFLTEAFRAAGTLSPDNRVTRITHFEPCPGGSTGQKLLLSLAYECHESGLHEDLFVKFSRDLDDPIRDNGRTQMEMEVRFAQLSRNQDFPIAVPACLFADYHAASGTGILIAQRITYGEAGIEPHYEKCLDYLMPDPLDHYRALIRATARLAGAHRSGRLGNLDRDFPFEPDKLSVGARVPYTSQQLQNRVARYALFADEFPQLLPANIRAPAFIDRLREEVVRFPEHEAGIMRFLSSDPDLVALCHWNANIDNAWFFRNAAGALECGLLDWGNASRMNVAMALWGSLSAAELKIWEQLDELLDLFVTELRDAGGPSLPVHEVELHLYLYIAVMGLAWLLDAPPLIRRAIPDLAEAEGRTDRRFEESEIARTQLHMLTIFLHLWKTRDFGGVLEEFLQRRSV